MNEIVMTVRGRVGTDVELRDAGGSALAWFRVASTPRIYDRASGSWRDGDTVWLTVKAWRGLAEHVKSSVARGEPVLVTGRLKASTWKDDQGHEQTRLFVEAASVGHDLTLGTAAYHRTERAPRAEVGVEDDAVIRRLEQQTEGAGAVGGAGEAPAA